MIVPGLKCLIFLDFKRVLVETINFLLFCVLLQFFWPQVVAAILRASRGRGWYSKHILADAIDEFYTKNNLYPSGMHSKLSCIEDWKERMGLACARLAAWCLLILKFVCEFISKFI